MVNGIETVLFDLDGTLADTAPDLSDSLNRLLLEQNRQPLPHETIRPFVSHGGIVMICMAFDITEDHAELPQLRTRFLEIYRSCLACKTRLFEGMDQVLTRLESAGITWGVVTNKPNWLTRPLLQSLNIEHRAGCIVSGDTVAHSKPHPAPMLHACELLDCRPATTLYIGDARRDIEAGHNACMHTLVAQYGYLGKNDIPESWGADGMVNTPGEILEWLDITRETG